MERLQPLDPNHRQVCWSHIRRDFRRHADGLAEQKIFGEAGFQLTGRVFASWRAYQHEHHDRDRRQAEIAAIQTELRQLRKDASPKRRRTRWRWQVRQQPPQSLASGLTFTILEGVEPTNNPAERALSAAATCRMQHRSLFTYLSELLAAHNRGDPFPALT